MNNLKEIPMITAIETEYAGCRFRSRLEARWAVFFDHLGIKWAYEPQGYEIPTDPWVTETRGYLPDFWLPDFDVWCEVKGQLDHGGMNRILMAACGAGLPLSPHHNGSPRNDDLFPWRHRILMLGDVPREGHRWLHTCLSVVARDIVAAAGVSFAKTQDNRWVLIQMTKYKPLNQYLVGESPSDDVIRRFVHGEAHSMVTTLAFVEDAYNTARSARFEFGETPRVERETSRIELSDLRSH
jgi:hypothetical protein